MKIVIEIEEAVYKACIPYKDTPIISSLANYNSEMTYAIANGTPLPKGHGDLISRQAVIDMLNKLIEVEQKQGTDVMNYGRERVNAYESILDEIESDYLFPSMPSAEQTAEWKLADAYRGLYTCSNCRLQSSKYAFCPQCGARMKESEEEE